MILSHKHKFIFIKSPKTAGTSIQVALEPLCGPDDIVTSIRPFEPEMANYVARNNRGIHSHSSARLVRKLLSRGTWKSYFKFAFERNPWDRTISNYWFRRFGHSPEARNLLKRMIADPASVFPGWLRQTRLVPNYSMYTNRHMEIMVDFMGSFERLQDDFDAICDRLGLDPPQLPRLKSSHREDSRHYSYYYQGDEELIGMVGDAHRWEIDTFKYEFEDTENLRRI